MSVIPYKPQYSHDELRSIFYPLLIRTFSGREPRPDEGYSDARYMKLINRLLDNPFIGSKILHQIFGNPQDIFGPVMRDKEAEARLDLFAMSNRIEPKSFKRWYREGTHDVDVFLAIKRFLIDGTLYIPIPFNNLNVQSAEIFSLYPNKFSVFLIDGDNLYYHIGPIFKLLSPDLYSIVFYRVGNISPIYAGYLTLYNRTFPEEERSKFTTVESYGARKEAADVELITCMARVSIHQTIRNTEIGKYSIVTGDESAHELIETTNGYFNRTDLVQRLNSQLIDFTDRFLRNMRPAWTIDPRDFPMNTYGELNSRLITGKLRPIISVFDGGRNNLNNLLVSTQPSTEDPINTMWAIDYVKSLSIPTVPADPEYFELFQLLLRIDISSYGDLVRALNEEYNEVMIRNFKEQYLVLIGAKYFSRKELLTYFFPAQLRYLNRLRAGIVNQTLASTSYIRDDNNITIKDSLIVNEFFRLPINNKDVFNMFYKNTFAVEAYLYHIDVPIALSIYKIETALVNELYPENIQINNFSFYYYVDQPFDL